MKIQVEFIDCSCLGMTEKKCTSLRNTIGILWYMYRKNIANFWLYSSRIIIFWFIAEYVKVIA